MSRTPLSVTIITFNEERNLQRCIESVKHWVQEIIVVDSGSTDNTCAIAKEMGAKVIQNTFQGYGQQKNFAHQQATHDWVLNLDADESVSPELALEIQTELSKNSNQFAGYLIPRLSYYLGRWIRHGGWYPNRLIRLYNRKKSTWSEPDVHEACIVQGPVMPLKRDLLHWPFTNIREQIETNLKFSKLGAQTLVKKGVRPSLFLLLAKPVGKFLETYVFKMGFLDGLAGFIISVNAAHSMFLKYSTLFEIHSFETKK